MIEGRAATGLDRLPWLEDETHRPAPRRSLGALPWIALLVIAVAALSYWIGARGWEQFAAPPNDGTPAPRSTLTLPEARRPAAAAQPDVVQPQVEPSPVPAPPVVRGTSRPRASASTSTATKVSTDAVSSDASDAAEAEAQAAEKAAPVERKLVDFTPWPVRELEGASSRLVQVGTFKSRHQAKVGWKKLMRVNPSLQRLPALVVPVTSARNGHTYYRLQMGTTSQAHSAALCQKLRMISLSCVVVRGTPPKAEDKPAVAE